MLPSRTLTLFLQSTGRPDLDELTIDRPPAEVQHGGSHAYVIISSHPLRAASLSPSPFLFVSLLLLLWI